MDYRRVLLMQAVHSFENVKKKLSSCLRIISPFLLQSVVEMPFLSKLHNKVNIFLVLEVSVQLDDIRVVQSSHYLHFISELVNHPQLLNHFLRNHFQSVLIFTLLAHHTYNFAISALTKTLYYFKITKAHCAAC